MAKYHIEPLIEFVPSKKTSSKFEEDKRNDEKITHNLDGNYVRTFYEDLVKEDGTKQVTKQRNSKTGGNGSSQEKESKQSSSVSKTSREDFQSNRFEWNDMDVSRFLRKCQEGNVSYVVKSLQKGMDVNSQDLYGWTPLMCAAYGGHNSVARLLLESGADWSLCDKQNNTARDIADQNGQTSTVTLIDDLTVKSEQGSKYKRSKDNEVFFCDICNREFSNVSLKSHLSSTVHLFNRKLKPPQPSYLIGESNVGYRMMLRSGWNIEGGLGPEGEGRKYPVKTILKRNREGLGMEKTKTAKVTHFKPKDTSAVKSVVHRNERRESVRTLSRRAMRRREQRNKDWEKRLRQYMNSD